jgi:hypothetical protein
MANIFGGKHFQISLTSLSTAFNSVEMESC